MTGTKRIIKLILNLILPIVGIVALLYFGGKLIGLFMPFFVGWIISLIANPLVQFLEKKLKLVRKVGSVVVIVVVLGLVVLACYGVIIGAIREIKDFSQDIPTMVESVKKEYADVVANVGQYVNKLPEDVRNMIKGFVGNIGQYVSNYLSNINKGALLNKAGNFAANVPDVLAGIIFGLLSSYFFIAEKENVDELFRKIVPASLRTRMKRFKTDLLDVIFGYFRAQLKIMFVIYVLICIGFAILKVPYFLIWGFLIALLDMLPIFGTGTVLLPWAVIEILSGDYKMVIGLLVIYVVTLLTHQLIQPKLIGDSIGLNPFATLFFIFVGFKIKGVIGMVLAIPIGMILYKMLKHGSFDTILYAGRELCKEFMNFFRLERTEEVHEEETDEASENK